VDLKIQSVQTQNFSSSSSSSRRTTNTRTNIPTNLQQQQQQQKKNNKYKNKVFVIRDSILLQRHSVFGK
jgi:hypothetical protein